MASPLYQSIELLSREKGIEPEVVVGAVEDAIALATRKYYKTTESMRAELDKETGELRAYIYKTVVENPEQVEDPVNQITLDQARAIAPEVEAGGELRFYKDTSPLGRIAAQMAKQVIFQKVREAERDTVYNEYNHRVGEVLTATVKRLEPMDVIFDIGKAEARMPRREQSRLEQFAVGERTRVVLQRVDRASKGPQVIVSRAAPELVQSLFQGEVPEIYDGTVMIRAIAREAGERTKIAVVSRDKDVDPVGACVGMKGMRVQSIIRELRGEKIDIIEFSEEITTFAEKALQPAKVSRVSIVDLTDKQLEVIVDDTQLSLAIGKRGQNVRLAAKLLGWKIDIKSEEEKRQEVEQQMQAMEGGPSTPIDQVTELGPAITEKLIAAGITTVEALADMTPEQLEEIPGIGERTMEKIGTAVRHYYGEYLEGEERPPAKVQEAADISPDSVIETEESDVPVSQEEEAVVGPGGESSERIEELSIEDLAEKQDEISGDGVDDAVTHALVDLTEAPMVSPEDEPQTAIDIIEHSDPTLGEMERPERADHELAGEGGDYEDELRTPAPDDARVDDLETAELELQEDREEEPEKPGSKA